MEKGKYCYWFIFQFGYLHYCTLSKSGMNGKPCWSYWESLLQSVCYDLSHQDLHRIQKYLVWSVSLYDWVNFFFFCCLRLQTFTFKNDFRKKKYPGPGCSKLTTSLVNDSLKFTSSDMQIRWNFLLKNVSSFCSAKATHIFSAKNIRILYIVSAKTVNEMTLN